MNTTVVNQSAVTISDPFKTVKGEMIRFITTVHSFELMEKDNQHEAYLKDARRILDAESKRFNPEGLNRVLGALILEFIGNNYFGKEN